jgi:hypothetical protein
MMEVQISEQHSSKQTNSKRETISERKIGAHSVRYKGLCARCNSGWMNDLENEAKPILENLIYMNSGSLTPSESLTLATWLYKTSALYQLTGPPDRRKLITREDLHHFYRFMLPPGDATIHICSFSIKPVAKIHMFLPRTRYGFPKEILEESSRPYERCFVVYLQLHDLLLSYTYRTPVGRWASLRENDMPERRQLWPISAPIMWSKGDSLNESIVPKSFFVEFVWQ